MSLGIRSSFSREKLSPPVLALRHVLVQPALVNLQAQPGTVRRFGTVPAVFWSRQTLPDQIKRVCNRTSGGISWIVVGSHLPERSRRR
jgi:hypothetical protein